jgi:hypothetical protein
VSEQLVIEEDNFMLKPVSKTNAKKDTGTTSPE